MNQLHPKSAQLTSMSPGTPNKWSLKKIYSPRSNYKQTHIWSRSSIKITILSIKLSTILLIPRMWFHSKQLIRIPTNSQQRLKRSIRRKLSKMWRRSKKKTNPKPRNKPNNSSKYSSNSLFILWIPYLTWLWKEEILRFHSFIKNLRKFSHHKFKPKLNQMKVTFHKRKLVRVI